MDGRIEGIGLGLGHLPGDLGSTPSSCRIPENLDISVDKIDIPEDMFGGPQGKARPFIDRTKGTAVPRAVSGDSDQQTVGFTRRPDGPLLETAVCREIAPVAGSGIRDFLVLCE